MSSVPHAALLEEIKRFTIPIVRWLKKSTSSKPARSKATRRLTFQSYVESVLSEKGLRMNVQTLGHGRIDKLFTEHTNSGKSQPLESEFPKARRDDSQE
jgi:hypothetical protein